MAATSAGAVTAARGPGDRDRSDADRLRRVRMLPAIWLASASVTSLLMPGIGLLREERTLWLVLGTAGVLGFALAQGAVLVEVLRGRCAPVAVFLAVSALSVPLVAPVAAGEWASWAWIGASVVGTVPILLRPLAAAGVTGAVVAVGAGVAAATAGSPGHSVLLIVVVGAGLALVIGSPVRLWRLIEDAHAGREAIAALAVAQERLRFARDVHDSLGHALTVIGLQAELIEREDGSATARRRAGLIRTSASAALADVRSALTQRRASDLRAELDDLRHALESSGVRCTVSIEQPASDPRSEQRTALAAIAREAVTNVLRHSRASRCDLSVRTVGGRLTLAVRNDGVLRAPVRDPASGGLAGARERAREVGGSLEVRREGSWFEVRVTLGAP